MSERRRMGAALLASLLLHAGIVVGFSAWPGAGGAPGERRTSTRPTEEPAVSFVHLVESPKGRRTPPPTVPTDIGSDRSLQGATPVHTPGAQTSLPQSHGVLPVPSMGTGPGRPEVPREVGLVGPDGGESGQEPLPDGEGAPAPRPTTKSRRPGSDGEASGLDGGGGNGEPAPSLPLPSALGLGGMAFNTLAFDFAPYALRLKQAIASHWFPPVAFTEGGLFGGVSVVRFRIEPDGRMSEIGLVSGAEHQSLDTAALNAVRVSAPFDRLPDDFPEEFLEVTFSFHYILTRQGDSR